MEIDGLILKTLWEEKNGLTQVDTDTGRHYSKDGIIYHSVTTILGSLNTFDFSKWREEQIAKGIHPERSAIEGDHMHKLIECYFKSGHGDPTQYINKTIDIPKYEGVEKTRSDRGYELYKNYNNHFLKTFDIKPHLIESKVYCHKTVQLDKKKFDISYAGTLDLAATVNEEGIFIIDHKSLSDMKYISSKKKGYIPQLAAYVCAVEWLYGIEVAGAYLNFSATKDSRPNKKCLDLPKFKSYKISKEELYRGWQQFKRAYLLFMESKNNVE
jgi:hypothetical protein